MQELRESPETNGNTGAAKAPQIPDDGTDGLHVMTHVMKVVLPGMVELVSEVVRLPASALDRLVELRRAMIH